MSFPRPMELCRGRQEMLLRPLLPATTKGLRMRALAITAGCVVCI